MNTYPQRVIDNIIPFSTVHTLPEAFEEWFFTENTVDHGEAIEICHLCDKEEVRYHFEIKNSKTNHTLWVGSRCILKFNVPVYEDGKLLSSKDAEKKIHKFLNEMRYKACIKNLEALALTEKNDILVNALDYYHKNKYLTPKYAAVIFWKLRINKIDHNPKFFKVSLKRNKYKQDLSQMEQFKIDDIWPALTPNQRDIVIDMGFSEPVSNKKQKNTHNACKHC